MKKFNRTIIFAFAVSLSLNFNAQEYAMNIIDTPTKTFYNNLNESEITPILYNKTFTYNYQGKEVLVVFNGSEHIEYFNNKKHYIKSEVSWNSKDECTMILKESNLPKFPFKKGTKLAMKITKIKGNTIYYESTLGGRTWEGK